MIKILFICTPTSIHDIKWMSYFANKTNSFKVYAIYETAEKISNETKQILDENNIILLAPIPTFSLKRPLRTWYSIYTLRKIIKKNKIDIIHALVTTPHALWTAYIKQPCILTNRGSDILLGIPELLNYKGFKKKYFALVFKTFKKAFNKAEIVTGTSKSQIDKTVEIFNPRKVIVIRTGVNIEAINRIDSNKLLPEVLRNQKYIFSPRFLSKTYNVGFQIDAMPFLKKDIINDYYFIFIRGQAVHKEYYEEQLQKLKYAQLNYGLKFLIFDYFDQQTLWTLYKYAALTLITPLSDGTPNSAIEAMALRCPLILSDINYDRYLFDNTCLKVELNNIADLIEKIDFALNCYDPQMLEYAYNKANLLGNRMIEMNKLESIYQSIKT